MRKYLECIKDCDKAIELDENNANAYSRLGYAFYRLNEYGNALNAAEKALTLDPLCVLAYCVRGNLYADQHKDFDKALADYNKGIELNGTYAEAYRLRGFLYANKLKDYDKALADYNKAIELDESFAENYKNRGSLYNNKLNEYDKALADYNKAIELDATYAAVYNNRGILFAEQLKDYGKALADFTKAIELDEGYAGSYSNRGYLYADKLKEFDKALADYNKAIELDESFALAYRNRGVLFAYNLKDIDNALIDYNKVIELDEAFAEAYRARGVLYANKLKDYDKALADYNKAIELDEAFVTAFCNRGVLYADHLKDIDKALADYNKAIELDETNPLAYINRGRLFADQIKDYRKALADFNKAIKLDSKNNYYQRYINSKLQEINGLISKSNDANHRIKLLMEKIDASGIEDSIKQTKESFRIFISEKPTLTKEASTSSSDFIVLRRWNSYTPIIADNNRISKGGGYFYNLPDCGIVIDPGFNFIDNFKSAGFKFHQIDHVLITHAHNDHTTDLESILTLLHQYNKCILGDFDSPDENTIMQEVLLEQKDEVTESDRKRIEDLAKSRLSDSPRRKRLRIYMSTSTYKKYSPMLNLNQSSDYDIVLIKATDKLPIICPMTGKEKKEIKITAVYSKHNDLLSDRDSLGFVFEYQNFVLIYTGDTGFNTAIEVQYRKIKNKYKKKSIVLLAHLGGFKEYEKKYNFSKSTEENSKSFYKHHLGRLGLAKLVETVQPLICIISEFGEEFRKTRLELTNIFQEVYADTLFIPADIGLCINSLIKVRLIDKINPDNNTLTESFYKYNDTKFCESQTDASLHYYKKGAVREADLRECLNNQYHLHLR